MPLKNYRLLFVLLILLNACSKKDTPPAKSNSKIIKSFVLRVSDNSILTNDVTGVIGTDTIVLNMPEGKPLDNLVPTIVATGADLSPASKVAQNFSTPIKYTVTAEDGSTKIFTVIARVLNSQKNITSFIFKTSDNPSLAADAPGIIYNDTIAVHVPVGTNITSLIPAIKIDGVSVDPASGVAKDFTLPVNYTVTADDKSTKGYTVLVSTNLAVFVGSNNGNLYALDAITGNMLWKYNAGGQISSPVYADGYVYAGNGNSFFALDALTGTVKWNNNSFHGGFTSSSVMNGTIYVGYHSADGYGSSSLYALDEVTGNVKWSQTIITGGYGSVANPTAANGIVYVTEFNTGLSAYDAVTGTKLWSFGSGIMMDKPCVHDGVLYVGTEGTIVSAVNATNGALIWNCGGGGNTVAGPVFADGVVYAGGFLGIGTPYLFAINAFDGTIKWKYKNDAEVGDSYGFRGHFSSPYVFNNTVYAGNDDNLLYAVDAINGTSNWTYENTLMANFTRPDPVVSGGVVFVNRENNNFYAIDAKTGLLKWKFESDGGINTDPCVVDASGNVYYPGHDGN